MMDFDSTISNWHFRLKSLNFYTRRNFLFCSHKTFRQLFHLFSIMATKSLVLNHESCEICESWCQQKYFDSWLHQKLILHLSSKSLAFRAKGLFRALHQLWAREASIHVETSMSKMTGKLVAVVQMTSTANKAKNLATGKRLIGKCRVQLYFVT